MCRLSGLQSHYLTALCAAFLLSSLGSLSGCQLAESRTTKTVAADSATLAVQGLTQPSQIAKNAAGMPIIETSNVPDLLHLGLQPRQ